MSRNEVVVTCYVCRRELCSTVADGKGQTTYHAWLICDACLQDAATTPESSVDPALAAGKFGEHLRDAVAEVAADHVEGKVWRIDDLSEDQVADIVAGLPDLVKSLAEKPLDGVAGMAGIPGPAASPGADVMAAFLLKPVLGPMESAVHAFEVTGIIIGLLTGLHPLVIICLKHLAHDELGAAIADAVEQILSPAGSATAAMSPTAAAHPRPGAGETTARRGLSPGASPREAGATASPRSSADSAPRSDRPGNGITAA